MENRLVDFALKVDIQRLDADIDKVRAWMPKFVLKTDYNEKIKKV